MRLKTESTAWTRGTRSSAAHIVEDFLEGIKKLVLYYKKKKQNHKIQEES